MALIQYKPKQGSKSYKVKSGPDKINGLKISNNFPPPNPG